MPQLVGAVRICRRKVSAGITGGWKETRPCFAARIAMFLDSRCGVTQVTAQREGDPCAKLSQRDGIQGDQRDPETVLTNCVVLFTNVILMNVSRERDPTQSLHRSAGLMRTGITMLNMAPS